MNIFLGNCESGSVSPDARTVAYAVKSSDRDAPATHSGFLSNGVPGHAGGGEIWVTETPDGETRVLTPDWGSSWCPRWSPDGKHLAFYSDRYGEPHVWLWDREGGTFRIACREPICVFMGFEGVLWTPDARRLVVKLRAPGWNPPGTEPTGSPSSVRDVWTSPPEERSRPRADEGWHSYDACRGDIAVVDIESSKVLRLGTEVFPFGVKASADGRYVAAMCFGDFLPKPDGNTALFDLHLFALDGSVHRVLAPKVPGRHGTAFSWSPRSDEIAYTSYLAGSGALSIVGLDGGERMTTDGGDVCLGHDRGYPPLWSPDAATVYCTARGRVNAVPRESGALQDLTAGLGKAVLGIAHAIGTGCVREFGGPGSLVIVTRDRETVRDGLYRLSGARASVLVPERDRSLMNLALCGDSRGDWIVGPVEDAANPQDLVAINGMTGEECRTTRLNPHIAVVERGPRSLISYRGPKGESLLASLLLPLGHKPGTRHPTILNLYYGLRNSGYTNLYDPFWGRLAGKGYALLAPDMPWSDEGPADRIAALALAAADAVVDQGYADPLRMGVMGGSLGGYAVCCVVTRTDRFRAAVAEASFCDLVSHVLYAKGNTLAGVPWVEGGILRLGTTLWEAPQRYIENSPVFRLDRVKTPLLLLHGTADDACPIHQAEEMYAGLLRLGKVATLVRYHGAGHVIGQSPENHGDTQVRILEWFDRYLRGETEEGAEPIAEQPD